MKTSNIKHYSRSITRKIGYVITGLVIALVVGPVFIIGAYTILASIMSP